MDKYLMDIVPNDSKILSDFRTAVTNKNMSKVTNILKKNHRQIDSYYLLLMVDYSLSLNNKESIEIISKIMGKKFDMNILTNACLVCKGKNNDELLKIIENSYPKRIIEDNRYKFLKELQFGDYLYGLSEERQEVLKSVIRGSFINKEKTIDYYNLNFLIDCTNTQILDNDTGKFLGRPKTQNINVINHYEYLIAHDKYNPTIISEDSIDVRNLRIKKACKAAISHVLQDGNKEKIHFILKNFDALKALNKTDTDGKIKFTNTEFRLIYRQWLKSPEKVDQKIVFWSETLEKIKPTQFFNKIGPDIKYIPDSQKDEGLNKLKEWANADKKKFSFFHRRTHSSNDPQMLR